MSRAQKFRQIEDRTPMKFFMSEREMPTKCLCIKIGFYCYVTNIDPSTYGTGSKNK